MIVYADLWSENGKLKRSPQTIRQRKQLLTLLVWEQNVKFLNYLSKKFEIVYIENDEYEKFRYKII